MEDQGEGIARIVREDDELQACMDAEAKAAAHGLIQGYLGPDHKVPDMGEFLFGVGASAKDGAGAGAGGLSGAMDLIPVSTTSRVWDSASGRSDMGAPVLPL